MVVLLETSHCLDKALRSVQAYRCKWLHIFRGECAAHLIASASPKLSIKMTSSRSICRHSVGMRRNPDHTREGKRALARGGEQVRHIISARNVEIVVEIVELAEILVHRGKIRPRMPRWASF